MLHMTVMVFILFEVQAAKLNEQKTEQEKQKTELEMLKQQLQGTVWRTSRFQ